MKKKFNVQIEYSAKIEIANAYDWYEDQEEGLGESFIKAFQKAIESIQKAPNGYTQVGYHRQFPLKHFPFVILYEIDKETMYIDAVFHTSRNPKEKIR
jgi:plasmid stabilization system protein ParE